MLTTLSPLRQNYTCNVGVPLSARPIEAQNVRSALSPPLHLEKERTNKVGGDVTNYKTNQHDAQAQNVYGTK